MNLENIKNDISIAVSTYTEGGVKVTVETKVNPQILPEPHIDVLHMVISDSIKKLNEVIKEH